MAKTTPIDRLTLEMVLTSPTRNNEQNIFVFSKKYEFDGDHAKIKLWCLRSLTIFIILLILFWNLRVTIQHFMNFEFLPFTI